MQPGRRAALRNLCVLGVAGALPLGHTIAGYRQDPTGSIMTVSGPVDPADLGFCLPHEHLLSRFGAEPAEPPVYDSKRVDDQVLPYLAYLKTLGITAIADCTAYNFGRAPEQLRQLAETSELHLITNTGYYGAADDRYVPATAYRLTAEQIATEWIREFEAGIGDTGVRPGFVKTAVDPGPLSEIDAKLIHAAALTHRATGLTLAVHTGNNVPAAAQIRVVLEGEGLAPDAWTWTHAQDVPDPDPLLRAAESGTWISLDGIKTPYYQNGKLQGSTTLDRHLEHLLALREAGFLNRVLLSHDGSAFPPAPAGPRPMDFISNTFLPLLRASGVSEEEIETLTITNPARYFTIRKRLR